MTKNKAAAPSDLSLQLNGEARHAPVGSTLGELAAQVGLDPRVLLVEHNGTALPTLAKGDWTTRPVSDGDQVEFIRIVAGG